MDAENLNHLWANLIIEELARLGVLHFLIAPGSRSAPLAVAAARNPKVTTLVHFDERGAAFAALGSGKTGRTAAVICSSGTAVANCFPAVAEASLSATPLIILSADRPPELQGCGANQTMKQDGLFANFSLFNETLPCPDPMVSPQYVLERVGMLVSAAGFRGSGGPVHLNCMYREPLAPMVIQNSFPSHYMDSVSDWETSGTSFTEMKAPVFKLSQGQIESITKKLTEAQRGLLLIGPLYNEEDKTAVMELAAHLRWPIFADIASNCRSHPPDHTFINRYDTLLRSEHFRACCSPDLILHVGDVFVSKRLYEHLGGIEPEYIQLISRKDVRDPIHRVTTAHHVNIVAACQQIVTSLKNGTKRSELLETFQKGDQIASQEILDYLENEDNLSELSAASIVNSVCPKHHTLFIGNSMPIRDMDMLVNHCNAAWIGVNRGVSGIDGNIATAAGMAWASNTRTIAYIGDMTALHDINSLALLTKTSTPVVVVIVNNKGGGIFSFLPIARNTELLDTYFTNPHDFQFDKAAAFFGLPYYRATSCTELQESLHQSLHAGTSAVIEVAVDREVNMKAHAELAAAVTDRLQNHFRSS